MADSKITALTALTAADPANDMIPIVDVSDTPPASGNTKRISINNILACSPSATLASLNVTGSSIPANGLYLPTTNTLEFAANSLAQYRIAPLGVFSWYDGAGGTRMTLNSTGLGVGMSPQYKLQVGSTTSSSIGLNIASVTDTACIFKGTPDAVGYEFAKVFSGRDTSAYTYGSYLAFYTEGKNSGTTDTSIERLRIDSSGNVGIGVTPKTWVTNRGGIEVAGKAAAFLALNGTGNVSEMFFNSYYDSTGPAYKYAYNGLGGRHEFGSAGWSWLIAPTNSSGAGATASTWTQAMTLDASGNLLVGAASFAVNNGKLRIQHSGLAGEWGIQTKSSTTDGYVGVFYTTTGQAGFISVSGTSTTFSTTSDYRLKESVQPLIGGLARINNLKPSTYKWKADGSNSEGFIAHELAEVVPAAVTGQKDAVNADGSIKPQGVDLSKLVPILVAAIQELSARVQTLEAK